MRNRSRERLSHSPETADNDGLEFTLKLSVGKWVVVWEEEYTKRHSCNDLATLRSPALKSNSVATILSRIR